MHIGHNCHDSGNGNNENSEFEAINLLANTYQEAKEVTSLRVVSLVSAVAQNGLKSWRMATIKMDYIAPMQQ